ncbi:hypothetical protein [Neisseria dumasiana]|uniref:hypothetical protein n=1 Tax=Neisseria dumasiana TaxID=1931275 RepID=UPI001554FF16|nr:hypothetical protein [Neisseria dumasiana]UOO85057.1 hypothetical protein LVJ88_03435 [Neisseria dumasiana]
MIERLMPIFAVIGILSTLGYAGLAAWAIYSNIAQTKKKRPIPRQHHHTVKL